MRKDIRVFNCGLWYGGHLHKGIYYGGEMHERLGTDAYPTHVFGPNGTIVEEWLCKTEWLREKYAFAFSYTGETKIAINCGGYILFNDGSRQKAAITEALNSGKYGSHWTGKHFINPVTVTCPATATVGVCINAPINTTSWTDGKIDAARGHGTIPVMFGNGVTEVQWGERDIQHVHKDPWAYTEATYSTEELWLEKLFYGCETLTEFPHEMLKKIIALDDYKKIHALSYAFANTGISEIKNGEFLSYDIPIWNGAFQGCKKLKTLPEGAFGGTFWSSAGLNMNNAFADSGIETLPDNLFSGVGATLDGTFRGCTALKHLPPLWETRKVATSIQKPDGKTYYYARSNGAFEGCTGADNYDACPAYWKEKAGKDVQITEAEYNKLNAM